MAAEGPRLKQLRIENYRSIGDWVEVTFPTRRPAPLVLIGENNAGKSNILRALTLVLGETWPGNHNPEDHEFFGRSPEGVEIRIHLEVDGIPCPQGCASDVVRFVWKYCKEDERPCEFSFETDNCSHTWMSNSLRNQLTCITVGVDRNLSYQLSYASKWTTLSKLMRRFHAHLTEDESRVKKLKGFFDDLISTFYEVDEFKRFADSLTRATRDFGGNLPYGLNIDFSAYDASNFFRSLRVLPQLSGEARAYEELGTGQEQVLAMAFAYAYAKAFSGDGLVLAIEEPEAHLHPLAQEWVAAQLQKLSEEGVQILLTTHSPQFVDLSLPGANVLTRKSGEGQATTVIQLRPSVLVEKVVDLGASAEVVDAANIGPFYENSATNDIKAGLFARACILVEGPTEQLALSVLFARLGIDLIKGGIAVVPVEGVTNLPKWVRYFLAHEIPVFPVFDSDSSRPATAAKNKSARQQILRALGFPDVDDWSDIVVGPIGVARSFGVLDPDYEQAMRSLFGDVYTELEDAAREIVGNAKPLVARYVARQLPGPDETPSSWARLRSLATRCSSLAELSFPQ
jgi:putative ATP-dependent endonuclease of OLD family